MRGQHYRARDKTVRKMGRDGLTEENLRSGETVRISRREVDDLALPGTADDSINFQERRSRRTKDRKAGGRQRGGYFRILKDQIMKRMAVYRLVFTRQTGRGQIPIVKTLRLQNPIGKMCREQSRIRKKCRKRTVE